uniref:Uncharacterized protein n=1 Tax=Timema shepardi TaxID=629360 RepID=A0A7R9AWU1_TIMSH|nr:unnamed protein product [Timema shepardi]
MSKLALSSPTDGVRCVDIARLRDDAMLLLFFYLNVILNCILGLFRQSRVYIPQSAKREGAEAVAQNPEILRRPQAVLSGRRGWCRDTTSSHVLKQAGEISSNRSSSGRGQDAAATTNMTKSSSAVAVRDPSGSGGSSGASSVGSLHRRQPPLMLRGASSSLTVAPVLHASTSAEPTLVTHSTTKHSNRYVSDGKKRDGVAGTHRVEVSPWRVTLLWVCPSGPAGATFVPTDSHRRRRLFAGMKSLSMLGARGGSPSSARSISLPERTYDRPYWLLLELGQGTYDRPYWLLLELDQGTCDRPYWLLLELGQGTCDRPYWLLLELDQGTCDRPYWLLLGLGQGTDEHHPSSIEYTDRIQSI